MFGKQALNMYRILAEAIDCLSWGVRESRRPEDRKLATDYLAALAPLLALATLGKDILRDLPDIDRLLGQTWLVDETPFRAALKKWRAFKEEYEKFAVSGMTVNERLHAFGILDAFDRARSAHDRDEARRLLQATLR